MVDPKDLARIGSTSLILGCHLKAIEIIGEGISNLEILLLKEEKIITFLTSVHIYCFVYLKS